MYKLLLFCHYCAVTNVCPAAAMKHGNRCNSGRVEPVVALAEQSYFENWNIKSICTFQIYVQFNFPFYWLPIRRYIEKLLQPLYWGSLYYVNSSRADFLDFPPWPMIVSCSASSLSAQLSSKYKQSRISGSLCLHAACHVATWPLSLHLCCCSSSYWLTVSIQKTEYDMNSIPFDRSCCSDHKAS